MPSTVRGCRAARRPTGRVSSLPAQVAQRVLDVDGRVERAGGQPLGEPALAAPDLADGAEELSSARLTPGPRFEPGPLPDGLRKLAQHGQAGIPVAGRAGEYVVLQRRLTDEDAVAGQLARPA